MSNERDVCSSGWKGNHGTIIRLKNPHKDDVKVYDCGSPNCSWPFASPASPFTVPANGYTDATLKDNPGSNYCYCTAGCPGQGQFDTNPKTVIIS